MNFAAFGPLCPSFRWTFIVSAATLLTLLLFSSGIVFAVMPLARYLIAAGVDRIVLERGVCYGRCPAYRLTIQANGAAAYTGESFVRLRGTYQTRFNTRKFGRLAAVLYRRGMFASRHGMTITDAPSTRLSIIFTNGTVVDSVSYGFSRDDLDDDIDASATYIDGFVGRLCDWHRIEPPLRAGQVPGWFSPISTVPCPP